MSVKEIFKLLRPEHQNLPALRVDKSFSAYPVVYIPVIQGEEESLKRQWPRLRDCVLNGKKDEFNEVFHHDQVLRLIGVGKRVEVNARTMRRFYGKAYLNAIHTKPKQIAMVCSLEYVDAAAAGVHVAALDPGMLKSKWEKQAVPEVIFVDLRFAGSHRAERAIREGKNIAEGKNLVRILGTLPPNILDQPTYAEVIKTLAKEWHVPFKQVSQKELKKYELLQAVSLGSGQHSELLILKLEPKGQKSAKATAVIGKGICYDSGGLIGKQDHMKCMKEDMAGSAILLAAILTIKKNEWSVKETTYFLLPIAQNLMGSQAMRADDIWTAGDGQKVEVTHTDAEGRLILADAICYVKNNFKNVDRYFTIATLTGSCLRALGDVYTGLVCNDKGLAEEAVELGQETGDYLHSAPWDLEYDDYTCPIADVPNMGENALDGGWIKGGLFMHRFLPKNKEGADAVNYCHLDIAGTIDMFEKGKPWRRKGFNSGVLVGLLAKLLTE